MSAGNDPRANERGQLILALVTFALQLDAFELQTQDLKQELLRPIGKASGGLVHSPHGKEDGIARQ